MPVKQSLKEHFENGRLDLSMAGLTEVPVKEIAAIPKATSLDLSSNRLTIIGKNFPPALTHLVYLDLAKNQLVELPENFGLLVNLKHLDLYSNQLTSLPLSFGNLKALRWLDLKQNLNLMPKLAQIAGPCLDSSQCAEAAKNVVELLAMMNKQVEVEKQRRQEQRQKQLEENEKKAQEIKKEQQLLKKKNKKARKEDAENAKLLDSVQNGNLQDGAHDNTTEELGYGDVDNLETRNGNDKKGKFDDSDSLKKSSKPNKVVKFFGTLTKVIVVSTLLIILGLFILNLLDENYYNAARKRLIVVRNQISGQLPKPFLTKMNKAFVSSRKLFWRSANHMGKLSMKIIQDIQDWYAWMSTHETVQLYFEQIKSGWQVLWIRISEIYRTFMVDAQ